MRRDAYLRPTSMHIFADDAFIDSYYYTLATAHFGIRRAARVFGMRLRIIRSWRVWRHYSFRLLLGAAIFDDDVEGLMF